MTQSHEFNFDPSSHTIVFMPVISREIGAMLALNGFSGSFSLSADDANNKLTLFYPDGQSLTSTAISSIQSYLTGYVHDPTKMDADEIQLARRNIAFGQDMYQKAKKVPANPDVAYWSTYLDRMSAFTGFSIVKDPIPNAATKAIVDAEVGQTITDLGKLSFYLQYPGSLDANNVVQPTAGWWPT